jgi:DNA-binding NarL/FixJ family response regulator
MRVLVADDNAKLLASIRQLLAAEPNLSEIGQASDGDEALDAALSGDWDVVVLDVSMPKKSGLQVLQRLRIAKPHLPVVILSVHSSPVYVLTALGAGALGYINKEAAAEELAPAIRCAAKGDVYVAAKIRELLGWDS